MKKKYWFLILILSSLLVLSACGKKSSDNSEGAPSPTDGTNPQETTPIPNHKTQAPDLGIAKSFGIMAYISIASSPSSSISGKVGLKPGARSLIGLSSSEVVGGSSEIYAGDDVGDPQSYLTMAREDLIGAYKDLVGRATDKDKIDAHKGEIGGKILPPGTYRFSNGANILSNITLEGNDTDVWVFQVDGDINVGPGVQMNLSGGALAKNIYWQASGRVVLGSNSVSVGTFINQLTSELKQNAQLTGRILCKNGKVLLTQNVIKKPER